MRFRRSALSTRQRRAAPGAPSAGPATRGRGTRRSVGTRSRRGCGPERGSESASISTTVFFVPSTSMSSRAQKKCWWTLAATPGAISVACGPGRPRARRPCAGRPSAWPRTRSCRPGPDTSRSRTRSSRRSRCTRRPAAARGPRRCGPSGSRSASRGSRCPPRGCRSRSGRGGAAARVVHPRVEVADLAEAVAAQLERVHERAEAVLADVERVLEVDGRVGVAVGDDELGDRRAVAHRRARAWAIRCSTSPSRGEKPTSSVQPCHASAWPSRVKLGAVGLGDLVRRGRRCAAGRSRRAGSRRPRPTAPGGRRGRRSARPPSCSGRRRRPGRRSGASSRCRPPGRNAATPGRARAGGRRPRSSRSTRGRP